MSETSDENTTTPKNTIGNFSGNVFNTTDDTPVNKCKMKCELTLNETDSVDVEKSTGSVGFKVNSNLFTVKYGNTVYSLKTNTHYITNNIVHEGLFNTNFGIVNELVFVASYNNFKMLYIHIPIYKSFNENNNGKLLRKISNQEGIENYDISELFPKNVPFYTYNSNNETSVVFTTSNIMIKNGADIDNIVLTDKIEKGIRDKTVSAETYNFFYNTDGIVEGGGETTIIDCQPIDDDGMLLADREKGLNQTGISQTSNLEAIGNKLMENPLAQTAIGVILLYILTKFLRTGQLIFKTNDAK